MRFKNISILDISVSPVKLKEAQEKIFEKCKSFHVSEAREQKWPKVHRKIQNKVNLRSRELKYALTQADTLEKDENVFLLRHFFERFNKKSYIEEAFSNILFQLQPWASVQMCLPLLSNLNISKEPYRFINDNKEIISIANNRKDFGKRFLDDVNSIAQIKSLYDKSDEMAKITKDYLESENTKDNLFVEETKMFVSFLFEVIPNESLSKVFENYIAVYLLETPNWTALLLDSNNPLHILITDLIERHYEKREFGDRLKQVFNQYQLCQDVISELKRLSLERGEYWEFKLKNFDSVSVKKFGSSRYGLAMFIKDYVIVEFAPKGNAAYFYDKNVFTSEIEPSVNWSIRPKAGIDIGHGNYFFNRALRDIKKGYFIHSRGWTNIMDKILKVLSDV